LSARRETRLITDFPPFIPAGFGKSDFRFVIRKFEPLVDRFEGTGKRAAAGLARREGDRESITGGGAGAVREKVSKRPRRESPPSSKVIGRWRRRLGGRWVSAPGEQGACRAGGFWA
jgi:hypothetical protein